MSLHVWNSGCKRAAVFVVIYESEEVGEGSLMRVTVAYIQRDGWKKLRVFTVWIFDVVQQLHGGQNPDSADCLVFKGKH